MKSLWLEEGRTQEKFLIIWLTEALGPRPELIIKEEWTEEAKGTPSSHGSNHRLVFSLLPIQNLMCLAAKCLSCSTFLQI